MKKTLITISVLGLLTGCATLSTQAISQTTNTSERGFITVSTTANTELAPDVAEISFAVKTSDTKSMQKATVLNKETSDKVLSALKSLMNTENGDYIKTSDFNASPIYSYSGSKKNLDKYEVSNRVIVHTKSLDKIGTMIDKAIESGATNVDSLTFSVSNYETQCNDLLGIATQKAKSRAGVVAKNLSTTLDGVKSIDLSCSANNNYNTPRFYMAKNMLSAVAAEATSATPTSISGGVIKVNANVNATFFVK